jgi:hypothetical protein
VEPSEGIIIIHKLKTASIMLKIGKEVPWIDPSTYYLSYYTALTSILVLLYVPLQSTEMLAVIIFSSKECISDKD